MVERLSTGFVDAVNAVGSVKTVMANSEIHIFSGVQPATADAAETVGALLLMKITVNGADFVPGAPDNGLNMGVSTAGVLAKAAGEVWQGTGTAAAGASPGTTAGWFRWYSNDVTTGASTEAVRVDGAIGTSSSYEMQMSNPSIVDGGPSLVNAFNYTPKKQ